VGVLGETAVACPICSVLTVTDELDKHLSLTHRLIWIKLRDAFGKGADKALFIRVYDLAELKKANLI
jgi:hypothetical protein